MSTPARRRLMIDLKRLKEDPPTGISGAPSNDDILKWNAVVVGPPGTPYQNGAFKLTLNFTEEYPNRPPTVKFMSSVFHPNVYKDGGICIDILQDKWSPAYKVSAILLSIQNLLGDPNPNSPANDRAAQLYAGNRQEYEKQVKAYIRQNSVG